MTTGGNNGGPLSGQHEGYQGGGKARPPLSTKFSQPLDFFGHTAACCTEYLCTFVGAYRFFTWATLPNGVHYLITTTTIT